jgi:hypothetical protein
MLRFAVFDQQGPARTYPLGHAYLIGPEQSVIPGDIAFEDGLIVCQKRTGDSAGLAVQFPVALGDPGQHSVLTLQTCLLPPRRTPYLLSLELARQRVMSIINKLEEWALFDLPADDPVMVAFESARRAFTDAVIHKAPAAGAATTPGADPAASFDAETDRRARHALALAVDAGEKLALRHASVMSSRRASGELQRLASTIRPPAHALTAHETIDSRAALIGSPGVLLPGVPRVGVTAWPVGASGFGPELCKATLDTADFLTMPMRWVDMEPTEGRYTFQPTDRWIEWAVRVAKMPVVGGPLVDFRRGSLPEWLYIWEHDYDTLRELVGEYVKNIVTRYRKTVGTWTVVSGVNASTAINLTPEQAMDLTRLCILVVRKLQPSAVIQVEIDQPWGEFVGDNAPRKAAEPGVSGVGRPIPPLTFAELALQPGLNADVIGVRVHMGRAAPGSSTRDLLAFSEVLDRYAHCERPVTVTAVSAPADPVAPDADGEDGGWWRARWNPDVQARWAAGALAIAASKPYVTSVCWAALSDDPRSGAKEGLVAPSAQPRPALAELARVRAALRNRQPLAAGA